MLYIKTAAKDLIPEATKVEAVRFFNNSVQVTYQTKHGRCSTFLSKKLFKTRFVEVRKVASKQCVSVVNPRGWTVFNRETHTMYQVSEFTNGFTCGCDDYRAQKATFGKGCCKHIYHVLGTLGKTSLNEYLAA